MKTTFTLMLTALALCACHHDNHNRTIRRDSTNRYEQRRDDSDRRQRPRRNDTTRPYTNDSYPYLPPFTMRWDCPTEPQMLGYATR